ncbi:kinesin-domain-containing protein [Violaceomyces palustris]|uniref:Kinesin-domain-containing protein n=1 Tax=Violaceomyces palustris TaxID=1673888 RepID=A0ACD0NS86_9BASI|nr:kinesin-domain-containing protein [Violaceomyces palustris]
MAESSISVAGRKFPSAVRIRPFSPKEASQLAPTDDYQPFLGDGGLSGSPSKPLLPSASPSPASSSGSGAPSLRTRFLRSIVKPMDKQVLVFDPPDNNPLSRLYNQNNFSHGSKRSKDVRYAFDRVFDDNSSQQDVFEETSKPLIDGILNGYNASVFAYGATGCGKTHTISGSPEDPGLIFLTMKELYQRIEDAKDDSEVQVRLSYLEIYNETIRDLLSAEPTPAGQGLALREDSANKISVVGITEHIPPTPESVLDMLQEGNKRRTMSPTEANAVSSRSHAVLQINVMQRPRTAGTVEEMTSASLNIIDLAGSERASATRNNGARMKEGANINKSLLALGNCINALCQSGGQRKHVPYRNSKLTRLLKFSLGGNCKTVMIVCVSPSSSHYEETHNALKYANQAKNIRTKVSRNTMNVDRHVAQYVQAIHDLKEEVQELKAKLSEKGSLQTAAEKRRKTEISKEVEEAKKRMRDSTENVKKLVGDKSGLEAQVAAAEARLRPLRSRLQEVDNELASHDKLGEPKPSDLESEREILSRLIERDESLRNDPATQAGIRSLNNSLQMQRGIIVAASHNQKFDVDAAESVRSLGSSFLAEVEAAKATSRYDALLEAFASSSNNVRDLVTIAARCTVALKEAAGELDYRAKHASKQVLGSDEVVEQHMIDSSEALTTLATQLRSISHANDEVFIALAGKATMSPSATLLVASGRVRTGSTALRKPRNSLSSQPVALVTSRSSVGVGPPLRRPARRASLSTGPGRSVPSASHSPAMTLQPGSIPPPKMHIASSPRKPTRRQSVGGRRTSAVSLNAKTTRLVSVPTSTLKPSGVEKTKKAFRWADEAGEGEIDDKGAPHRRISTVRASFSARDSSDADESSLEQIQVRVNGVGSRQGAATQCRPFSDIDADASSGTEWEDWENQRSTHGAGSVQPSSTLSGSLSSEIPASQTVDAPAAKPKRVGIFDRNFLAKRVAANASSLGVLTEDDGAGDTTVSNDLSGSGDSSALKRVNSASPRTPFGELVSNHLETADASPRSSSPLERASPYKRRPSPPLSSVGPVRRKARSSLLASSSTTSIIPARPTVPPTPRVISGPPGNTAARLASSPRRLARRISSVSSSESKGNLGLVSSTFTRSITPTIRAVPSVGETSIDNRAPVRNTWR